MSQKLPYYMTYPMPLLYDDERIDRRDYEYIKSLYPKIAKALLPYVEDECSSREYPGSMFYDEYPDKLQLRLMAKHVYEKFVKYEKEYAGEDQKKWLQEIIEIILYQEMYKRRSEDRRMRRKFY